MYLGTYLQQVPLNEDIRTTATQRPATVYDASR